MFMKRFALLVLSVGVISCFQAAEASAAQEEAFNQNTVAVSEANETITPVQNNLSAIVPTAAPVAAPKAAPAAAPKAAAPAAAKADTAKSCNTGKKSCQKEETQY